MNYESSYDSGRMPFKPDLTRGYWSAPADYFLTGLSLAFRLDIFSSAWFVFVYLGNAAIVPYLICLVLFIVPFMVVQSFLGQFSSSGFISAFRIAPLFKGIGFISVGVNLVVLTYYSAFVSVPFLYLFHSFKPTLPWSCEGMKEWTDPQLVESKVHFHLCDTFTLQKLNISRPDRIFRPLTMVQNEVPSSVFFTSKFNESFMIFQPRNRFKDHSYSLELMYYTLLTWSIIAAVFYMCSNIEKLGKLLRYTICTTILLLALIVLRFSIIHERVGKMFAKFFVPTSLIDVLHGIPVVLLYMTSAFGAGWGTIIALASFNRFRTNLVKQSWYICLGQMFVFMAFAFLTHLVHDHFNATKLDLNRRSGGNFYNFVNLHWVLYLSTGSLLAELEWSNMWCIIFFTMLILAALVTMITILLSILQSLYDEIEVLRAFKTEFPFILIIVLTLCSFYTCSNHGISYFFLFSTDTLLTANLLNILLLVVVLWVYGRERFQRDVQFMFAENFNTCKVFLLRFVAPICFLLILAGSLIFALGQYFTTPFLMHFVSDAVIVLPWIFLPTYIIFILLQTSGSVHLRFKRCCKPTDWYPVESEDRQRYEETLQNTDITHQLNEFVNEIVY